MPGLMVKIMLTLCLLTAVVFPVAVMTWPNVDRAPSWAVFGVGILIISTFAWTVLTALVVIWTL